jgi:hypothetical protein
VAEQWKRVILATGEMRLLLLLSGQSCWSRARLIFLSDLGRLMIQQN